MHCPACGATNAEHRKFCDACGEALTASCPRCGAVNPGTKFCGECGAALSAASPSPATAAEPQPQAVAERRVVSILFADIVGFTPLSESRDAEAVRELLSRYFDTARTVVARYGGVVEKFIGDAVMAVWGVPTAHGDDAERAVRAALDLVESVAALGVDVGADGLAARAGVVTGEVAVTVGAVGEGMVAGDAVNTAARVQSAAEPGTVLVDDTTRSATARAIAFADTGMHELKGKSEPLRLWQVTRIVGAVGGTERVDGLEASFLGRDRELRTVKEVFHASVDERRARLVSVVGGAGVGKSRLRWEFFKYIDGLVDTVLWHSGRCLPYGDGVAYWALAEIVRARLDIAEEEPTEQVSSKLDAGLRRWVTSEADRDFLLPRLGALLGIADPGLGREELFAGWRLWFERLAEHDPVLLVVEDVQWADNGLLDFLEHLLDWSADYPIFVLTLTRPELVERRPAWGAGRRNVMSLALEPLPDAVMAQLLGELVPGLPAPVTERIVAQADGVPLYAVELIRSLIDRDLVQPVDGVYRLVGEVADLDVPASLTSLVAARIDALPTDERSLVQALAVLGSTFPRNAVRAVTALPADEVDVLLSSLVRKEILGVRTDRLSPDRGQYAFTQSLLRSVAYDTLSRRERKARHVAVATHLRSSFADDGAEVAEVIAQHYADAYQAVPDDPDADEIRDDAVAAFVRAGQRAVNVGAPETAERAFATAAELSRDEQSRAELVALAGEAAVQGGRFDRARELLQQSFDLHRSAGRIVAATAVSEPLSLAMAGVGRSDEALAHVVESLELLAGLDADATVAKLEGRLGRLLVFTGRAEDAEPHVERALELAQALEVPSVLPHAIVTRGILLAFRGRHAEALAMNEWGAKLADELGLTREALTAHGNAADLSANGDIPGAREHLDAALAFARRRGDSDGEAFCFYNMAVIDMFAGNWDSSAELLNRLGQRTDFNPNVELFRHTGLTQLLARRGDDAGARASLDAIAEMRDREDRQDRSMYFAMSAIVEASAGRTRAAYEAADLAARLALESLGIRCEVFRQAWPEAVDAAIRLGDIAAAESVLRLVADQPVGHIPPYLRAQLERFRARIVAASGEHIGVDEALTRAETALRDLGYPYWHARTQVDHAEWLIAQRREPEARALLTEATQTFTRLGARPDVARSTALLDGLPAAVTA